MFKNEKESPLYHNDTKQDPNTNTKILRDLKSRVTQTALLLLLLLLVLVLVLVLMMMMFLDGSLFDELLKGVAPNNRKMDY